MICDHCGKSNVDGKLKCTHCGAEMPKTTACGGFADILTIDPAKLPSPQQTTPPSGVGSITEGKYEEDMQKLLKKSDNIINSTQKNGMLSLIAIGLSFVILICSLAFGISTINSVNEFKEETLKKLEELQKEEKNAQSDKKEDSVEPINKDDTKEDTKEDTKGDTKDNAKDDTNDTKKLF